ncbi:hypothetical protein LRP49_02120 [Enterovibrio sp. ZSDZ35]|uniref:PH domain-containing protein n=1 Tax=Enterovibrio qingdaonensis TaxID=2899818 RepID=A0ABT5QG79_9GAMM|nr:hypothetical protein [Enterovibrio sp. ZSDZ35]MDD1779983.1 hypothetical protein [Enterovibrio sp. ZSDZ35]
MDIAYRDLYWGSRYHLKQNKQGQFYLVGVKQKIFSVFGIVSLIPFSSSIVMAVVSSVKGTGDTYFFIGTAIFFSLLSFVLLSRREHYIFSQHRVARCSGWRGLPLSEITFWPLSDCTLTVTPIVEHKNGCWLELSVKGERVWRNSVGNFEQTSDLAIFLWQQHKIEIMDSVSAWPNTVPLRASAPNTVSEGANTECWEYEIKGSLWRLIWVFPVTFVVAIGLYLVNALGS